LDVGIEDTFVSVGAMNGFHISAWHQRFSFVVGTVAGMVLITVSMASVLRVFGIGNGKWSQRLALVSGSLSVAFGALVAIQILLVNGLFTGSPTWTPK